DIVTGVITGTPTAAGPGTVTVTATDNAGYSGSTTFPWTVTGGSSSSGSVATTPAGKGYWLTNPAGDVAAFGDAVSYGSTGNILLRRAMVGIGSTPTGHG